MEPCRIHPLNIFGESMKNLVLGPRLKTAAEFVRKNRIVADVGTDHAYLIAYLILNNISPFGYACDINSNPLKKALSTVKEYGIENKVELVLCDGLDKITKDSVDDIVIAGMGGETIVSILDACPWSKTQDKHYILQPMSKAGDLRRYLCENGFEIEQEKAVKDSDKLYTVMSVFYTGNKTVPSDLFCEIGSVVQNNDEVSRAYIKNRAESILKKAEGIKTTNPDAAQPYFKLFNDIMRCL